MSLNRRRSFHRQRMGHRDANHLAIRDGLRKLGHYVIDLAGAGDGVPDLCVYARLHPEAALSRPVWFELKVGKGKLRKSQIAWRATAEARGVRVATVRTLDEALAALDDVAAKTEAA